MVAVRCHNLGGRRPGGFDAICAMPALWGTKGREDSVPVSAKKRPMLVLHGASPPCPRRSMLSFGGCVRAPTCEIKAEPCSRQHCAGGWRGGRCTLAIDNASAFFLQTPVAPLTGVETNDNVHHVYSLGCLCCLFVSSPASCTF